MEEDSVEDNVFLVPKIKITNVFKTVGKIKIKILEEIQVILGKENEKVNIFFTEEKVKNGIDFLKILEVAFVFKKEKVKAVKQRYD